MRENFDNELKQKIEFFLKQKKEHGLDYSNLTIEELVHELNVYYQELEFENEELKRVSRNLDELKNQYEDLFMNAPVGYVVYDEDYSIVSLNNLAKSIIMEHHSLQSNHKSPLKFDSIIRAESQDEFYFHIRSLLLNGGIQKCKVKIIWNNEIKTFILESICNQHDRKKLIRSALIDITQETSLEQQLQQATALLEEKNRELQNYHDRLEGVMTAGHLAWWQMDVSSGSVRFNENKTKMLGYESNRFTHYSHFVELVHPDDKPALMQSMEDYLSGKREKYASIYRMLTKDKTYKWFQDIGIATSWNADGTPQSLSGVVFDISELKRATEEAQRANRVKSEFLAHMSHEIRTPLNAVIGFIDILQNTSMTDEQRECLENANISAHSLLDIINDILDFSKIESGKLELEEIEWDITRLLYETIDMFKVQADKKGLSLNMNILNPLPSRVIIDPIRLKQVLVNLLGNAIKFTEQGGVTLEVDMSPLTEPLDGKNTARFTFHIRDTGIGISEEQKGRLFKAFNQADTSITRRFGGTGLGLAISSGIIKKMGGELNFTSTCGTGSDFYFSISKPYHFIDEADLPTKTLVSVDTQPFQSLPLNNDLIKVLVVDDVILNSKLTIKMIQGILQKVELYTAFNGEKAVELYNKTRPDIIFLDIQMPVLDGYSAARRIREIEKQQNNKPVTIIGLSAAATEDEIKEAFAAGMDEYLTKPITSDRLRKVLHKALSNTIESPIELKNQQMNSKAGIPVPVVHFDKENFQKHLIGDLELFNQLIEMSLMQFSEYKEDLLKTYNAKDWTQFFHFAHKFKGAAATMFCNRMAAILQEIELQKEHIDRLEPLIKELELEFNIVMETLQKEKKLL